MLDARPAMLCDPPDSVPTELMAPMACLEPPADPGGRGPAPRRKEGRFRCDECPPEPVARHAIQKGWRFTPLPR